MRTRTGGDSRLPGHRSAQPDVDVLVDLLPIHIPRPQPQLELTESRILRLATRQWTPQPLLIPHLFVDVQFVDLLHDLQQLQQLAKSTFWPHLLLFCSSNEGVIHSLGSSKAFSGGGIILRNGEFPARQQAVDHLLLKISITFHIFHILFLGGLYESFLREHTFHSIDRVGYVD